jgi:hypothetical protein
VRLLAPKQQLSYLHKFTFVQQQEAEGVKKTTDRTVAQVLSRCLPIAAAQFRAQVSSRGICGGQSGTGAGFSEYFGFPCKFSFHRLFHTHHLVSSGAATTGQFLMDVPSGLNLTPLKVTKKMITTKRRAREVVVQGEHH